MAAVSSHGGALDYADENLSQIRKLLWQLLTMNVVYIMLPKN